MLVLAANYLGKTRPLLGSGLNLLLTRLRKAPPAPSGLADQPRSSQTPAPPRLLPDSLPVLQAILKRVSEKVRELEEAASRERAQAAALDVALHAAGLADPVPSDGG